MKTLLIICFMLIFPAFAWGNNDKNRQDYVYGTGNSTGGNIKTYVDPQTGDIVTSVVPPENKNDQNNYNNQGNVPIFVYPQVAPSWPATPRPPQP